MAPHDASPMNARESKKLIQHLQMIPRLLVPILSGIHLIQRLLWGIQVHWELASPVTERTALVFQATLEDSMAVPAQRRGSTKKGALRTTRSVTPQVAVLASFATPQDLSLLVLRGVVCARAAMLGR